MEPRTLAELEAESASFDAAVLATDSIDHYCSSSDWVVPAARALMPPLGTFIRRGDAGWVALGLAEAAGSTWLQPLEAMWGLACPIVGKEPLRLAHELAHALAEPEAEGRRLLLCGMAPGSRRLAAVASALAPRYAMGLGAPSRRVVARLEGGVDAYLARRTRNFRRSIERARRKAAAAGVRIERARVTTANADDAYQRLLAVDRASWKGGEATGLTAPEMQGFYRLMVHRLAARSAVRLSFARLGERDFAYILGTDLAGTYRGLQFSYVSDAQQLSLGNLCQLDELGRAAADGLVFYDFGSEVEYKHAWGDFSHETAALIAHPR